MGEQCIAMKSNIKALAYYFGCFCIVKFNE